ncbi:MAG: hypothetical protein K5695_09065 [Oscillospiraceae bacterium]|nr:hypothetical protein [Oscillospiraceae bacterium]
MKSCKKLAALAAVLALLLTGCGAERVTDEEWLGIMEQEIIRRDGKLPTPKPVTETPVTTEPYLVQTEPEVTETEPELPVMTEAPPATELHVTAPDGSDVYTQLCTALEQFDNTITVTGNSVGDEIDPAYNRVAWERPDLFWVAGYSSTYLPKQGTVEITTIDDLSPDQLSVMYNELMNKAKDIAAQAQAYPTDYEKILFVHDYIIDHAQYDFEGMASDEYGLWQTAYGALVQGDAVCEGYADGFQLVMQQLGIPCGVCSGQTEDSSHAWNWVSLGGTYYWIDVTWDDPSSEDSDEQCLSHKYFLFNDELLRRSRTIDDEGYFIPTCTAMTDNYYIRNNSYLEHYAFEEIDGRLTLASAKDRSIEVMFSTAEELQAAMTDLIDNGRIWDASVFKGGGGSYVYSYDDNMYTLMLVYTLS